MDTIIAASASCKVRAVIRFLRTEAQSAAEIHRRLCLVYGDNVISDSCMIEWCRKFRDWLTSALPQLVGAAMIASMFHQQLLLHYAAKMYEGRRSAITDVTCYY
jgi:hypothetical protein